MKIAKLLAMSALWLTASSAMADVPESKWTMPEPTGLEFTTFTDDGTRYYLYNPAAKMFFASGNSWGTQASVRTFGYPFWVEFSTEADAPEGSYELWDDFSNPAERSDVSGPHNLFTDDGGSTWVDHASQGNYSWTFTLVGDCVRFQNVALIEDLPEEYEGKYLGWTGEYEGSNYSSVLRMIAPDVAGTSVDWKAVTEESYLAFVENEEVYKAYTDGVANFFLANELHNLLVEAESLGTNIATQLAAFTNTESAPEDLQAAIDALKPLIDARKALKKALEDAKAGGFDGTAPYDAVYADGDATVEDLKAALENLNNDLVEWGKGHATVENPGDMTAMIVNPNFDDASSAGWSGSTPNMVGSGSHGPANVAETWNATFDMYQDISGLPAGVYALGAQTMWRGSWNDMQNGVGPAAKLYVVVGENEVSVPFNYAYGPLNTESMAGDTPWGVGAGEQSFVDDETGNTYYIPNDPSAFRLYAEKGLYDTKVVFGTTDGEIRIGVKNPQMMGDADNWSCYDTFTLTYYGAGADAAQLYLEESIKNYAERTIEEGTLYTEAYLTAYNEALKANISVSSFEDVAAALSGIEEASKALDENIALWKKWDAAVKDAKQKYVMNPQYADLDAMGDLSDYCDDDAEEILDDLALTNEELEAEIEKVAAMVAAVIEESKNAIRHDGDDMTSFIVNPGFEDGIERATDPNGTSGDYGTATGWTADKYANGNFTPGPLGTNYDEVMTEVLGAPNHCFEAWHCHKFDLWQEITDLPKGMYQLDVQGYVRCEVGGYNRGDDLTEYPSPVFLYMNSATAQFPNVYSECPADYGQEMVEVETWYQEEVNGNYYPNSMGGAAQCFAWDMYKMQAYGLIAKKGDTFRIGVRMDADQDWWCIFDNFKLTYREPTAEVVKPILEAELEKLDLTRAMGSDVYEQASKVKADADAAIAAGDGEAMFNALIAVYDLSEAIETSVALFTKLSNALESLQNKLMNSQADAATISEAQALASKISSDLEAHTIADADVEGLLEQITSMMTRLGLPANWATASDENPVDVTGVIQTPDYGDEIGENSIEGWTKEIGGKFGENDYLWVLAYESWQEEFSMYQDFAGLPEGTYEVAVKGFCRNGGIAEDFAQYAEDPNFSLAFVYAKNGEDTEFSVPMAPYAKGAQEEDPYIGGETEFTPSGSETVYYVPNDLASAKEFFDVTDAYQNKVVAKVLADGKLRIGVKKESSLASSWIVIDDWTMTYFGADSSKELSGDAEGITDVNTLPTMKVEFFTLDGRKAGNQQKGIFIQKLTLSNGQVVISKIRR